MRTSILNSLNQRFADDEAIDRMITDISAGRRNDRNREFIVRDGVLIYQPLNLVVLRRRDHTTFLTNLVEDDTNSVGKGARSLAKYIWDGYCNIRLKEVAAFLKTRVEYQLSAPSTRPVGFPHLAKKAGERLAVDLADMNRVGGYNLGFRYIMLVIDVFSRRIWLRGLRKKEAADVAVAMRGILNEVKVKVGVIQTDNGGEFAGAFSELLREKGIKHLHSRSYTPTDNSLAERAIQSVRRVIRGFMSRRADLAWWDLLPEVEQNRNLAFHTTVNHFPLYVWESSIEQQYPTRRRVLPGPKRQPAQEAAANLADHAERVAERYKRSDNYQPGDHVRLSMSVLSEFRKANKSGDGKHLPIQVIPRLYQIGRQMWNRRVGPVVKRQYSLLSEDRPVLTHDNKVLRVYASSLLPADPESVTELTLERALQLNGISLVASDPQI